MAGQAGHDVGWDIPASGQGQIEVGAGLEGALRHHQGAAIV
jgi:hypothetical protein